MRAPQSLASCAYRTDDGDNLPPIGEQQRLVNKDARICDEWEAMILLATALYCTPEDALVALRCLRDRPPQGKQLAADRLDCWAGCFTLSCVCGYCTSFRIDCVQCPVSSLS